MISQTGQQIITIHIFVVYWPTSQEVKAIKQ